MATPGRRGKPATTRRCVSRARAASGRSWRLRSPGWPGSRPGRGWRSPAAPTPRRGGHTAGSSACGLRDLDRDRARRAGARTRAPRAGRGALRGAARTARGARRDGRRRLGGARAGGCLPAPGSHRRCGRRSCRSSRNGHRAKGQPWSLARAARCRGLAGAGQRAETKHFERGARASRAPRPTLFEAARTRLAYGARLRRARKRVRGARGAARGARAVRPGSAPNSWPTRPAPS